MRIGILSHTQKLDAKPERYVSKNAANALLRRLLAVRVAKGLIQMVAIREMCAALPAEAAARPPAAAPYDFMGNVYADTHRIEPRVNQLSRIEFERQLDQDYLRFLHSKFPTKVAAVEFSIASNGCGTCESASSGLA